MAQINLLKQNTQYSDKLSKMPSILAKLFLLVLIGILAYYGLLIYGISNNNSKAQEIESSMKADRTSALNNKDRKEVLTRQEQLSELSSLIDSHVYWSQIIPILADSTLKTANYSNLKVSPDGAIALTVSVPSLEDLDKYLQVFDLPEYNKYFSNVRISGYHKVQIGKNSSYIFDVRFNFSPSIIQYKK